jgi:hypothetical protein
MSGPQYGALLRQAGLERYSGSAPAGEDAAACSVEELVGLYTRVYEMLGPTLTRLFHRNCGLVLAGIAREGAGWPPLVAQAQAVPAAQRLEWFVRTMAQQAEGAWTRSIITEDGQAWYLAMEECPTCQGIRGAPLPLCMAGETTYGELAKHLLGGRVRVTEVACRAMGAPYCTYAFDKAVRPWGEGAA